MGKSYTEEYKAEALKLSSEIGKSKAAKKLGIRDWTINRWETKAREGVQEAKITEKRESRSQIKELQEKIKEMEKEMTQIKKENEFLEEAARFFAANRQK